MTSLPPNRAARWLLTLAAADGLLAVVTGAFAAHATPDLAAREWLRTGAQYQLVHAVAAVAVLTSLRPSSDAGRRVAALFGVGGMVFAGSMDLLAITHARLWGAVTPLGGLLMIAGWATFAVQIWRSPRDWPGA